MNGQDELFDMVLFNPLWRNITKERIASDSEDFREHTAIRYVLKASRDDAFLFVYESQTNLMSLTSVPAGLPLTPQTLLDKARAFPEWFQPFLWTDEVRSLVQEALAIPAISFTLKINEPIKILSFNLYIEYGHYTMTIKFNQDGSLNDWTGSYVYTSEPEDEFDNPRRSLDRVNFAEFSSLWRGVFEQAREKIQAELSE